MSRSTLFNFVPITFSRYTVSIHRKSLAKLLPKALILNPVGNTTVYVCVYESVSVGERE